MPKRFSLHPSRIAISLLTQGSAQGLGYSKFSQNKPASGILLFQAAQMCNADGQGSFCHSPTAPHGWGLPPTSFPLRSRPHSDSGWAGSDLARAWGGHSHAVAMETGVGLLTGDLLHRACGFVCGRWVMLSRVTCVREEGLSVCGSSH